VTKKNWTETVCILSVSHILVLSFNSHSAVYSSLACFLHSTEDLSN